MGVFSVLGGGAVVLGHRLATSAVIDLGPTDESYVRDFREIERDGPLYFRWSSAPSSRLFLPLRFCGPGSLRLRARRHFVEPAILNVSVNGSVLGQRSIQARTDHPYDVIVFPFSIVTCRSNAVVLLETLTESNKSPLGVAVDWAEIRSLNGFTAASPTIFRGAAILALMTLAVVGLGGGAGAMFAMNVVLASLIAFSFASDPLAGERIVRGSLVALILTMSGGFLVARSTGMLSATSRARLALLSIVVATLVSRAAFLHPQAFYPDYRVHALVQQTFHSQGLLVFLDRLFETQYARSLGLQQLHGNWYPFPYPPGSYVAAEGVLRLFGLGPLDASTITAVATASLIPVLTMAIGLSLGIGEGGSLLGAFFVALQPLLIRRMALGYFPGLAGQLADAVAVLLMVRFVRGPAPTLSRAGPVALALLAAFLTYTQSIANFGLMVCALLVIELLRRSPNGGRTAVWFALIAAVSLSLSVVAFYSRYVPVLENVVSHRPQPESSVLDRLDHLRRNQMVRSEGAEGENANDPYAGTTVNPGRGLARLAARIWRFNGPFGVAVLIGLGLLWRLSDARTRNALFAWLSVCVSISLLAAGLPSPNSFQHLKDLEFVTPLFSLALGIFAKRLWDRNPLFAALFAGAWLIFAINWYSIELAERLVIPTDL